MTTNAPFKKIPLKMPSIAPSPKPPTMNDGKNKEQKQSNIILNLQISSRRQSD